MTFRTLEEWLNWQEGLHPQAIDLGLERVQRVFHNMGLGPAPFTVVTVAGTNGKGSSVAMLESVLQAAGHRTGAYTSPHLLTYNERIRINGVAVDDERICRSFERIERAREQGSLTYFEFGTLAALDIFYHSELDIVLLEAGMGGRLDAVNIIDPDVSLVTAIGIDHVAWLGSNREAIGREKAGIFRPGRPAVCSDPSPPATLIAHAQTLGTPLYRLGHDYGYTIEREGHSRLTLHASPADSQSSVLSPDSTWSWWHKDGKYQALPMPRLPGLFQVQNAAGILMVLEILGNSLALERQHVEQGLQEVALSGRFQVVLGRVTTILDVAHNRESAAVLAQNLEEWQIDGRTHAVVAMLGDKDIEGVFREMRPVVDAWYVADAPIDRGASAEILNNALRAAQAGKPVSVSDDIETAYLQALAQAEKNDRVIVFGSFYAVAAIDQFLTGQGGNFEVQSDPI